MLTKHAMVVMMMTYPIVHDGSEPERMRGMWIVPNLWKLRSSMPSAVKQGISHRMCEPRKSSADPRSGAEGVRRRFCFDRGLTIVVEFWSKSETKLGIWLLLLFHWWWWSWSGSESNESGVALREREPVLHVYIHTFDDKFKVKIIILLNNLIIWRSIVCRVQVHLGIVDDDRHKIIEKFTKFHSHLNITKNVTNVGLLSGITRSRPSTYCPI